MKIGMIVAMDKEFAELRTLADHIATEHHHHKDFVTGRIAGHEVVMVQCGIGKVNAAVGTVEMINGYEPDLVLSTGVAGGADAALNPLDVVVASECAYHDAYCGDEVAFGQIIGMPARFQSPAWLIDKASQLGSTLTGFAGRIRTGLTVSGEWFVNTREKMREILDRFPEAMAVDMESCAIAQVCHIYATPFLSFRIISDVPLKDQKAAQYYDFWTRMAEGSFQVTKAFIESLSSTTIKP